MEIFARVLLLVLDSTPSLSPEIYGSKSMESYPDPIPVPAPGTVPVSGPKQAQAQAPTAAQAATSSTSFSTSSSLNIIQYAPILAEMFLEISTSFDTSFTPALDYIYIELTKVSYKI